MLPVESLSATTACFNIHTEYSPTPSQHPRTIQVGDPASCASFGIIRMPMVPQGFLCCQFVTPNVKGSGDLDLSATVVVHYESRGLDK